MSNRSRAQATRRPAPTLPVEQIDEPEVIETPEPQTAEDGASDGGDPPTTIHALPTPPPDDVEPPTEPRYTAELTKDEVISIRRLNDAIDFTDEQIKRTEETIASMQKELAHTRTVRAAAQQNQIANIRAIIVANKMAPGIMYRADLESGQLVPAGPAQ